MTGSSFFQQDALTSEQSVLLTEMLAILLEGTNISFTVDSVDNTLTITADPLVEISGFIEIPSDKSITLVAKARTAFTINTAYFDCVAGTCDATVAINGTNVTGLTNVSVSTTEADTEATANNEVAVGDRITLTLSSVSGLSDLEFDIKGTR